MSVLEKIKEMQARPVQAREALPAPQSTEDQEIKVRRKAGVLAAFGLADKAIADTLFLTLEQVAQIKETLEFKESCSRQTRERAERLIDIEEGWDGIETAGIAAVLQYMQHSADPNFALRAALIANRAQRRTPSSLGRVIDASNVGNVIVLTMNKNYITNVATKEGSTTHATIEAETYSSKEIPRKASDISSPKRLSEILQLDGQQKKAQEIERMAEVLGISLDELDEIVPTNG